MIYKQLPILFMIVCLYFFFLWLLLVRLRSLYRLFNFLLFKFYFISFIITHWKAFYFIIIYRNNSYWKFMTCTKILRLKITHLLMMPLCCLYFFLLQFNTKNQTKYIRYIFYIKSKIIYNVLFSLLKKRSNIKIVILMVCHLMLMCSV